VREPLDVIDAIFSTPSVRYLLPDPIPEPILWSLIDAAIRGPSAGNAQPWAWIIVREPAAKRAIGEWSQRGLEMSYGTVKAEAGLALNPRAQKGRDAARHLVANMEHVPVLVVPALLPSVETGAFAAKSGVPPILGSSIYGGVQNLVLAARAYGIGSTLTGFYRWNEDGMRALLKLPEGAVTAGVISLGYPANGRFWKPRRKLVETVTHWGEYGVRRSREGDPWNG
jgi:nitroreductase